MKDKEKQIEEMEELAQTIYQKLFSNHTRFHFDEMSISRWVAEQSVEIYNKGIEKGSKEAAEKILKELLFVESVEGWQENKQLVEFGNKIVDKIEELAKQYGIKIRVEIKE